jgi:hypothetical protein
MMERLVGQFRNLVAMRNLLHPVISSLSDIRVTNELRL